MIVTVYGLLFYLWLRHSRSWFERLFTLAFSVLWIGLIALSRLALGAHWPSDVIAGLFIGCLWLATVAAALERSRDSKLPSSQCPGPVLSIK